MKIKCLLVIAVTFSLSAFADDVEIKTTGPATPLPADGSGKLPPSAKPPPAADLAMRSKVRKKAPFWIDDHTHGAAVRLNKDGSFISEAQGGGSIAGHWKIVNGVLQMEWSNGEKYGYPVGGKGKDLTIKGRAAKKNRFNLN